MVNCKSEITVIANYYWNSKANFLILTANICSLKLNLELMKKFVIIIIISAEKNWIIIEMHEYSPSSLHIFISDS